MTVEKTESQSVKLNTRDWLWLVVLIASAIGAHYWQFGRLDEKWQVRTDQLARDFRTEQTKLSDSIHAEIAEVRKTIPPDWFRSMLDRNSEEIQRVENQMIRDFVRKEELEKIIRAVMSEKSEP